MSTPVLEPDQRPVLTELNRQRSFATSRAITALMLREMSTTYGRSPIGYLWAILQPVAGIVLLTLVFSLIFRAPPIGKSFGLFYATGLVPFLLYMEVQGKLATSIQFSRQLLIYPSVTVIDAILARFILNLLTQLLVAFILFAALMSISETHAVVDLAAISLALAMAAALGLGVGVINAFLFGMFDEWIRIWAVLNRPMFIVSCVLFLFETIPEPYRGYLWFNPLIHIIGQMRRGFYPLYEAEYVSPAYVFLVSLVLLLFGLIFLKRYAQYILTET